MKYFGGVIQFFALKIGRSVNSGTRICISGAKFCQLSYSSIQIKRIDKLAGTIQKFIPHNKSRAVGRYRPDSEHLETEEVGLGLTQSLPSRRGWSGPPMTWMHPTVTVTVTAMRQRDRTGSDSDSLARLLRDSRARGDYRAGLTRDSGWGY